MEQVYRLFNFPCPKAKVKVEVSMVTIDLLDADGGVPKVVDREVKKFECTGTEVCGIGDHYDLCVCPMVLRAIEKVRRHT